MVSPVAHVAAHHLVVMATVATQLTRLAVEALPGVALGQENRARGEVVAGRVDWAGWDGQVTEEWDRDWRGEVI